MINQNIQMKITEVEGQLKRLREISKTDPIARREAIREIVGDAEIYLEKLLVFLRRL